MRNLEEFWYGNLDPPEYESCTAKEYKKILQRINQDKGNTKNKMDPDQQVFR